MSEEPKFGIYIRDPDKARILWLRRSDGTEPREYASRREAELVAATLGGSWEVAPLPPMPDTPDPRAEALSALVRDSEDQKLYAATTPGGCTPAQLEAAARELMNPKPATFADFIDLHRPLLEAILYYHAVRDTFRGTRREQVIVDTARARLNAEAERLGISW